MFLPHVSSKLSKLICDYVTRYFDSYIVLLKVTGASIQVASEMLPNSTERTVTISGIADSITQCIYHICCVMLEVLNLKSSTY